jgi:hypothetical protein
VKIGTVRNGGWAGRSAARVMGVLAVAGTLLGGMARPAAADDASFGQWLAEPLTGVIWQAYDPASDPTVPLRMDLWKVYCKNEQGDGIFDLHSEPYVVVFAADTSLWYSRAFAVRSQIFSNVDDNETHYATAGMQVYDFNGMGSPIVDPDKLIFLCALMESDDSASRADAVRNRVQSDLIGKLSAYRNAGYSRATIVSYLKNDMTNAINAVRGGDDRIGGVQEVRWTLAEVQHARTGTNPQATRVLTHVDSGAEYWTYFTLNTTNIVIN